MTIQLTNKETEEIASVNLERILWHEAASWTEENPITDAEGDMSNESRIRNGTKIVFEHRDLYVLESPQDVTNRISKARRTVEHHEALLKG